VKAADTEHWEMFTD